MVYQYAPPTLVLMDYTRLNRSGDYATHTPSCFCAPTAPHCTWTVAVRTQPDDIAAHARLLHRITVLPSWRRWCVTALLRRSRHALPPPLASVTRCWTYTPVGLCRTAHIHPTYLRDIPPTRRLYQFMRCCRYAHALPAVSCPPHPHVHFPH